ncbi:MAG: glycogen/starch synthase, partial [Eubacteriales bacterium]|nr:glycogen/starch synthase [Eubacteriales bacterium]
MKSKKLKVLYVSAEVSPFAKTGGLADVAGSLPGALTKNGLDVRIAMPRYKPISADMKYKADFPVLIWDNKETCIVREGKISYKDESMPDSVPVYFIDNYRYFDRDGIYCFFDDGERFAFFCKAVLEMLPNIGFKPDIIHCNDWHTGPICILLKEEYKSDPFYSGISTVFTIHNLQYQGNFPGNFFNVFNLRQDIFTPQKAEFYGAFSFMKTGIVYADKVNTVSEKYAEEIQTPQYGEKMEGILKSRKTDLSGILNGISYQYFDPETDNIIFKNYSSKNFEDKKENKPALQKELDLPIVDVPVLAIISRLSGQKGLDLVIDISKELLKRDVQLVILGTGDSFYEEEFRKIKKDYPDKLGLH